MTTTSVTTLVADGTTLEAALVGAAGPLVARRCAATDENDAEPAPTAETTATSLAVAG